MRRLKLLIFLLCSISLVGWAEDWVPKGFEHLVDGGTETSVVDVFYQGRLIVQTEADFSDETIEFADPYAVAYALPNTVINKEDIVKVLSKKIDANVDLKCPSNDKFAYMRCMPRADVIAAVLDRNRYSVVLYVAPEYMKDNDIRLEDEASFLTPSTDHLTYSSRFGGNFLGGTESYIYSLRNYQYLSKGAYSIQMQSLLNHNSYWSENGVSDFYIYDFSANYTKERRHYALGLLSTPASYFMPMENIVGFQLKSTNRLRRGGIIERATPIEIEVAVPSIATFYANGQQIISRSFNTGMHIVDTSAFPSGAYSVDIAIEGIDGKVEKKTVYFLKNTSGVEPGYPEYNLSFGWNRGDGGDITPNITGDFVLYSYYAFAYSNRLSLYLNAGYDESFQVSVGPGFYWRPHEYIRPTFAYDTKDGFMYSAAARSQIRGVNVGGSVTKTRKSIYDHGHMYNIFANYRNRYLGTLYTSYTVSNNVNFQAYLRRPLEVSLFSAKPLRLNAELGTNQDHHYIRLAATQVIVSNKSQSGTVTSNVAKDSAKDEFTNTSALTYNTNYVPRPDAIVTAGIRADQNSFSVDGNLRLKREVLGNQLNTSVAARQVSGGKKEYYIDANISRSDSVGFYITKDGFGYSRDMNSSTGAIVELEGEFDPKDLYVNHGNERIKFNNQGVSKFISIPPYQSYQIDISNDSEQAYDIQAVDDSDRVRLFPGNIAIVKYKVKRKYPLYASFSCWDQTLANETLVSSIDTSRTDQYGFTTLDVAADDIIYVLNDQGKKNKFIRFSTKGIRPSDGFAFVDNIECIHN